VISREAVAQYLGRSLNSYLWMKSLSVSDIRQELRQLRTRPVFKTEPWLHQLVCFYIALAEPRFLYLLDMGLGKSKILLDIMTQLQRERKLDKALVLVPRRSNLFSWSDAIAEHSELEPWLCRAQDTEEKWEQLVVPRGDVVVMDYAGLHLALCKKVKAGGRGKLVRDEKRVRAVQQQYNFLALDESHKLANHNSLWFALVNQLSKTSTYCYSTTGTLFGKDVEDLWGQFYLTDRGETFGENLGLFRSSFFTQKTNPWRGVVYTYNDRMDAQLNTMLQHKSLRYDESEINDLPARVYRRAPLDMTDEQRQHYLRALEGLINAGGQLDALDAQWLRMRQITSGYLAWKDEHGKHFLAFKENPKMDKLEELLDAMGDSKVVVCYDYTETGRLITERVAAMGLGFEWYYGGTKDHEASRTRFLKDPACKVLVMNSEAGGTGNDGLQQVARYMIFYESPTPPITRKQTEKRIHRSGQKQRVFIYDLTMRKSADAHILDAIAEGVDVHDKVVNGRISRQGFLAD
jgi:SNF2 family DNA or RNA helicase